MKKRNLLSLVAVMTGSVAIAAPLTPEAAMSRLQDGRISKAPSMHAVRLVHTGESSEGTQPAYYVFENDGGAGFIIVSADDRCAPLLAAVESTSFDMANMPPALEYWLNEYSRQVEFLSSQPERRPSVSTKKIITSDRRTPVEPLCKTKWDQTSPYNSALQGSYGRAPVVGCVATAMAQAMKVFNWPETGKGANSYTYNGENYYMDFAEAPFRWEDMLDDYEYGATTSQKEAVAQLMKACGISTNMMYGRSSSGTSVVFVTGALYRYFDYAPSAVLYRDVYSDAQWNSLIYEEIAAGRPVIYSGLHGEGEGGHSFICDGYNSDGLFHINWGWSGRYDGYFRLTALDPSGVGTGGGQGSYNYKQHALVGIAPKGTPDLPKYYPFYATGGFTIDDDEEKPGIRGFNFGEGYMACETGIRYVSTVLGVMVMKDGVRVTEWSGPTVNIDALTFSGTFSAYSGYTVDENLNGLTPGVYTLYPAVKIKNDGWYRIPVKNGFNQCVYLQIDEDGTATYSNDGPLTLPNLEIEDVILPAEIKNREEFEMEFTVRNYGADYKDALYITGSGEGNTIDLSTIDCDFTADSEQRVSTTLMFDGEPGIYEATFTDSAGEAVSMPFRFELTGESAVSGVMSEQTGETEEYDLSGRKVSAATNGIVIKVGADGGRKVIK